MSANVSQSTCKGCYICAIFRRTKEFMHCPTFDGGFRINRWSNSSELTEFQRDKWKHQMNQHHRNVFRNKNYLKNDRVLRMFRTSYAIWVSTKVYDCKIDLKKPAISFYKQFIFSIGQKNRINSTQMKTDHIRWQSNAHATKRWILCVRLIHWLFVAENEYFVCKCCWTSCCNRQNVNCTTPGLYAIYLKIEEKKTNKQILAKSKMQFLLYYVTSKYTTIVVHNFMLSNQHRLNRWIQSAIA